MYECFAYVYVYAPYSCSVQEGQKREVNPLRVEYRWF